MCDPIWLSLSAIISFAWGFVGFFYVSYVGKHGDTWLEKWARKSIFNTVTATMMVFGPAIGSILLLVAEAQAYHKGESLFTERENESNIGSENGK